MLQRDLLLQGKGSPADTVKNVHAELREALRAAIVSGEGLQESARAANYESPVDSASAPTADELALTVLESVHELTGQSDVSVDAPFMDVGLSSLGATRLAAALEKQLGGGGGGDEGNGGEGRHRDAPSRERFTKMSR